MKSKGKFHWCFDCNQLTSNGWLCEHCNGTDIDDPPVFDKNGIRHREGRCPKCSEPLSECTCEDIKHRR